MPVLNNVCTNIEQYVNLSSNVSEQHVELRDSRISRDDSDVEKILEWFSFNYPLPNSNCVLSIATGISGNDNVNCHKAYEIGLDLVNTMVGNNFQDIKLKRSSKITTLASITVDVIQRQP